MTLNLDKSHPVFTCAPDIHEKSCALLESLKLNYFQYARCYKDGSFTPLISTCKIFEEMLELEYPCLSYIDDKLLNRQSYNFLWDETLPEEPIKIAREKHNYHNGLAFMKREKDYYDMIAFAMPGELHNKNTHYFNYSNLLLEFAENFIVENKTLFDHMDAHRIYPPEHMKDPNRDILCLARTTHEVASSKATFSLSKQEHTCLKLIKKGYSYKRIAVMLEISPRTVETYVNRIREKTGLTSKQQLVSLAIL